MRYPSLVPEYVCKTDIKIVLYAEGVNENGAPNIVLQTTKKCNWQDSAKRVLTPQKEEVQLTAVALFSGDIAPNVASIQSGYVEVFGEKRSIYKGSKARNPDGTVNFTRLELI